MNIWLQQTMKHSKVDLNLFLVFEEIYRVRNLTRVSQHLHITQPAVSNALKRLRETFDDQLFVYSSGAMMPTPVADNMIADVRDALALLNQSASAGTRFDPAVTERRFSLAMNELALLLMADLHAEIKSLAPKSRLNVYYHDRYDSIEELISGNIDLLIDTPQTHVLGLCQQPLLSLPYAVAMRQDHPLAQKKLTLEDYISAEHIHVSNRKKGPGHADLALHAMGERRTVAMRVQNYVVAAEVTKLSELLCTAPKILADNPILGLQWVPVPFALQPLNFHLFWNKNATENAANRWLRSLVIKHITEKFTTEGDSLTLLVN